MGKRNFVISASLALLGSLVVNSVSASAAPNPASCKALTDLQPKLEAAVAGAKSVTNQERQVRDNTQDPDAKLQSREDQLTKTIDIQGAAADQIRGTADGVEDPQVSGVLNNWADALDGFSAALQDRLDNGLEDSPDPKDAAWLHASAQRVNLAADAFRATQQSVCAAPTTT